MTGTGRPAAGSLAQFQAFAETRDPGLRDQLVEAHLGLARHLARRFAERGESYDDLVQVGSMALVHAVDRFDPTMGVAFSTFATRTILGELKRHFRDRAWSVRAPRRVQELYVRLGTSISHLSQELGRSPTIAELADDADATEEGVLEALEAGQAYRAASLDAPMPGSDDETLGDRVGGDDDAYADAERRAHLGPLLQRLPERERRIVAMRFVGGMTQSEIAARVGVSQMHVSRLLARSLSRLRAQLTEAGDVPEGDIG
jgi:RNA polymerase sigma-B factor